MGSTDHPLALAPQWYLAVFILPLLVIGSASVAIVLFGTDIDPSLLSNRFWLVLGSCLFVALVGGGNEEPGWWGFALPRFEERYAPVPVTLVLVWSGRSGTSARSGICSMRTQATPAPNTATPALFGPSPTAGMSTNTPTPSRGRRRY